MTKPIIIIGSGLAGYMLAKEFRKLDSKSSLEIVTMSDGCFYSKPLLSTALTNQKNPQSLALSDKDTMAKQLNATIRAYSQVMGIDAHNQSITCSYCDDSTNKEIEIPYSHLVLACGAEKIKPSLEGDINNESICSINSLEDYRNFYSWLQNKKHIAILGSGLVGCEFANDLINAGYQVDIISAGEYPLANLVPEPVAKGLKEALEEKGVKWHVNCVAKAIHSIGVSNKYEIILNNNSRLNVDGVLSAVGIRPQLKLAQQTGIDTHRGILVNRHLQTNISSIYALGDCAEVDGHVKQFVAPLMQCARALAKNLVGVEEPVEYPPMPVVVKTPASPLIISPPLQDTPVEWQVNGDGRNIRALCYDNHGKLKGFALLGECVREKNQFISQLPSLLGSVNK